MTASKILSRRELIEAAGRLREGRKRIVFANGAFDLLHAGHVRYLEAARAEGDWLAVGVNSDESVRRAKGPPRPIVPESERIEIVAALGCVDAVCVFEEDSPAASDRRAPARRAREGHRLHGGIGPREEGRGLLRRPHRDRGRSEGSRHDGPHRENQAVCRRREAVEISPKSYVRSAKWPRVKTSDFGLRTL